MLNSKQKSNPIYLGKAFNVLGYIYNPLKRIFLANQPEIVISESISEISNHRKVLVVGGGADNTLIELFQNQVCDKVVHVDVSSVLSEKAKNRFKEKFPEAISQVEFVAIPFLDFRTQEKFDAVIFPFFLDLFLEEEVKENIEKAKMLLKEPSSIYVVDFSGAKNMSFIMKMKINVLYLLFYPFTKTRRKAVPDYDSLFEQTTFTKVKERSFFKGMYQFKTFKIA